MSEPSLGGPAPDFRGETTDGTLSLSDFAGRWLVLYFYPADFTPGCTTEACDFRDASAALDAAVLGVSPDDLAKHRDFQAEHGLPFPLLSDPDHEVARAYGAYGERTLYGRQVTGVIRSTFLIAPDGTLADAMRNVRAKGHAERVAQRLSELRGS